VKIVEDVAELVEHRRVRGAGATGLVPTLGALHEGHLTLVRRAKAENARAWASIFVNPAQFTEPGDLAGYPRTLDRDLELLRSAGCDLVFLPRPEEIYRDGYRYRVTENSLSLQLEGASRPGHFDGVLTVVLKLLLLARPDRAYFGEKDYQQLELVEGLVHAFFLDTRTPPDAARVRRARDELAQPAAVARRPRARACPPPRARAQHGRGLPAAETADAPAREGLTRDYVADRDGPPRGGAARQREADRQCRMTATRRSSSSSRADRLLQGSSSSHVSWRGAAVETVASEGALRFVGADARGLTGRRPFTDLYEAGRRWTTSGWRAGRMSPCSAQPRQIPSTAWPPALRTTRSGHCATVPWTI
jgi:pantoate--beta-alanine ligase